MHRFLGIAVAGMAIGAGACSPTAPRATVTSSSAPPSASSVAVPTTAGVVRADEGGARGSSAPRCAQASHAFAVLGPGMLSLQAPTATQQQRDRFTADVEAFRTLVPDEVKADADVYLEALSDYATKLSEAMSVIGRPPGGQVPPLAEATAILESPEFIRATENLEAFFTTVCDSG